MKICPSGAQFEILVDGKPRSYRDIKAVAIETAEFFRSKNPNSDIAAKDLRMGEVALYQSGRSEREPRTRGQLCRPPTTSLSFSVERWRPRDEDMLQSIRGT